VFGSACGDDSAPGDAGADTAVATDSGADTGVDGGSGERLTILTTTRGSSGSPIAGVIVSATSSAGTVTGTTGSDGRVVLDGVAIEGATVAASARGFVALTLMNLTSRYVADRTIDGSFALDLDALAPAKVTISGDISNGMANGAFWVVTPDKAFSTSFEMAPMFAVDVRPAEARVAAVLELGPENRASSLRAGRSRIVTTGRLVGLPASNADATVDIDLAIDALPVHSATGSFPIPAAPHGLHDSGLGDFSVGDSDHPGWYLGITSEISADVDNTQFSYVGSWIAPTEATSPYTRYFLYDGPRGVMTQVDGWPGDGAQAVTFLEAVRVLSPPFGTPLRTGESVSTSSIDPASLTELLIQDESGTTPRRVWEVVSVDGDVALPAAPVEADLSGTTFGGLVFVCQVENPGPNSFCRREAWSKVFDVAF